MLVDPFKAFFAHNRWILYENYVIVWIVKTKLFYIFSFKRYNCYFIEKIQLIEKLQIPRQVEGGGR